MLSQLARVSDTSQLPIEIQNVAGRKAHAAYRYKLRSAIGAPSAPLFERTQRRSLRDIGQEFQKRNARCVKRPRWIPYSKAGSPQSVFLR
jgi:hypothetical protein